MADTARRAFFGLRMTVVLDGATHLDEVLNRMITHVGDLSGAWREIADIIRQALRHQFEVEGDPDWQPLSPAYAARKARLKPGAPILVFTGQLRSSLTSPSSPDHLQRYGPHFLEVGSTLRTPDGNYNLGLLHQRGAPAAHLPARPMLRLLDSYKTDILRTLRAHINAEPEEWPGR